MQWVWAGHKSSGLGQKGPRQGGDDYYDDFEGDANDDDGDDSNEDKVFHLPSFC